jgi:hypothetical protein
VDRVIEAWVRSYPSLELSGCPIYLSQELNLKPALIALNRLGGGWCSRKFGNPDKAY